MKHTHSICRTAALLRAGNAVVRAGVMGKRYPSVTAAPAIPS